MGIDWGHDADGAQLPDWMERKVVVEGQKLGLACDLRLDDESTSAIDKAIRLSCGNGRGGRRDPHGSTSLPLVAFGSGARDDDIRVARVVKYVIES